MINPLKTFAILLPMLFSSGCTSKIDRTLSTPSDTPWVEVEIKNPSPYTKPFPLEVVYISHKCMKSSINGVEGSREEKPSYNGVKVPLLQQGNSNDWHAKVAMKGGGSCEWTLSEFNLGIEYTDATHLGKDLIPGTAVGATIAFYKIANQTGNLLYGSANKLLYKPKLYPLIKRWSKTKGASQPDKLYLFGKEDSFKTFYFDPNPNKESVVVFHPSIDERKIVELSFPDDKKVNPMFKITYSNGDVVMTKQPKPDFNKNDSINEK